MKKIFFSALAALSLVACVQEAVVDTPQGEAIAFENAFVDNATRATSLSADNLNAFKVWGFINNTNSVIFDGTDVTGSGNSWSYTGTQYWIPNQDYYFAALAPVVDGSVKNAVIEPAEGESAKLGLGTVTFTNDGSTDLIYAQAYKESKQSGNPAVAFTFKHLLSKVKFTFTTAINVENITAEVSDIKITVPESGMINLASETPEWTIHQNKVTLEYDSTVEEPDLFTIPTAAYDYEIKFTVTLRQGGDDILTIEKASTVNALALEMGKAYNFAAEINPQTLGFEDIVFDVDGVDGWETGSTVDMPVGVKTATELVAAVEAGKDVVLLEDIDLDALAELITVRSNTITSNWTPVGTSEKPYTGVFDGNGKTIKNLKLVESEAKEGKAYIGFFGYAKNATIKNVIFENVYINIPCLDIDHSQGHIGAVAGSLEGTSTIENVTVKGDITVYATQTANGASRVAVVAGGNAYGDVTMKNVHVIANEGSSLIANNNTGALAGQLQGKMYFENCTSNIDVTVNKFFAGGLVGIAAGDSKFVNCRTTGNVAVVAGREGRHNDEYRVGGIAGGWADGKTKVCTLENCSYTGTVSGKNTDGTTAEPLDYMGYVGRGYTLSNCAGSKVVIDGKEFVQAFDNIYGIYIINGVHEIGTATALRACATVVNDGKDYLEGKTIKLVSDIDLNNEEWIPIGSAAKDHGFMGNFDGNGYTIKNLKMTDLTPDSDGYAYAGLFGVTEGTSTQENYIKNLTIENVTIETDGHIVAAAVAYPYYTTLENITVKGNINIMGGDYTAGVLAYTRLCVNAENLAIIGKEDSVIKGNNTVGGVISDIQMNGGLTANYSNFSASGLTIKGEKCVGGISGIISNQRLNGATVKNVTLDCKDKTTGIIAGATGGKEKFTNVSYENVSGASHIIGATYGGLVTVTTADELIAALENNQGVYFLNDIKIEPASMSNAYGATGINIKKGQTIDGNGYTLNIKGAGGTWDSGINTTGGLIKNLTVTGSFRGIFINHTSDHSEKVVLENVTIGGNGTVYTISCDQGLYQGIEATNCTFNGWTSFAKTAGEAKFVNCTFGEGSGYKYCRPYSNTEFVNCTFCPGYTVDTTCATVTFTDCTWKE